MKREMVHLLVSLVWGIYGIVVGAMGIAYSFSGALSYWLWISIIVAITGNSAHMVAMSMSTQGIEVQTNKTP